MIWIGKEPPLYVREDDIWENERNGKFYYPDFEEKKWICDGIADEIPFPKKTKISTFRTENVYKPYSKALTELCIRKSKVISQMLQKAYE